MKENIKDETHNKSKETINQKKHTVQSRKKKKKKESPQEKWVLYSWNMNGML